MANTMVTQEDHPFGTDVHLMGEVLITGRKVGAGRDFWATLAHDQDAFRRALTAVQGSQAPLTPEAAARIMGSNFHGVEHVSQHFGVSFTPKQLKRLDVVPFGAELLQSVAETRILVAGAALSIMDVHAKAKGLFYATKDTPWYGESDQRFATKTKVTVGWHLVRKTPLPGSTSKSWSDQQAMVGPTDTLLPACLVVYTAILHALVTGERILPGAYIRTSDVTAYGLRVNVGRFGSYGLGVDFWGDGPVDNVGVAVARKFS